MIYHTEGLFQIAFGDGRNGFDPSEFKKINANDQLFKQKPFGQLQKSMNIDQLVFLHQVHGENGLPITSLDQAATIAPFQSDGDYLITTKPEIGLAIVTADCLPIVLYNPVSRLVAIVHAGWRGSVQSIAAKAAQQMALIGGGDARQLRVFFGPSAKRCCYAVGDEVLLALDSFYYKDLVIQQRTGSVFFDLPLFNRLQLQEVGVPKSAFNLAYNRCTICNPSFCSFRRDRNAIRQMTVVALR